MSGPTQITGFESRGPKTPSPAMFTKPSIFGPLKEDNRVLIFAGVRGCGKTERLIRMLQGLGEDAKATGVIITEIQGASPRVDLSRLPSEIKDTVGIEGCACCAANKQLLEEMDRLKNGGRRFFLIEQSGYSDATELARTLEAKGYNPAVIAVINPRQLESFGSHQFRHARSSSVILTSHLDTADPDYQERFDKLECFVDLATSDCGPRPIIVDNLSPEALLRMWKHAIARWEQPSAPVVQINTPPTLTLGGGMDARAAKAARERTADVGNFSEVLLYVHRGLTAEVLTQRLQDFRIQGDNTPIVRAKGVIGGFDVDIIRVDDGRLVLRKTPRGTPFSLFDGRDYLCVSSTNRFFKELALVPLAQRIGMIDVTEKTIAAIRENYPSREELFEAATNHQDMLVVYPEDRNLDELLHILPYASGIEDKDALGDLGYAVADLLYEHMRLRTDILEVLDSPAGKSLKQRSLLELTAGFTAARVLYHPQLARMIAQDSQYLGPQAALLKERNPAKHLIDGILTTPTLAINEEVEVDAAQREIFQYVLTAALRDGSISREDLLFAVGKIDRETGKYPNDKRLGTWKQVSEIMKQLIS